MQHLLVSLWYLSRYHNIICATWWHDETSPTPTHSDTFVTRQSTSAGFRSTCVDWKLWPFGRDGTKNYTYLRTLGRIPYGSRRILVPATSSRQLIYRADESCCEPVVCTSEQQRKTQFHPHSIVSCGSWIGGDSQPNKDVSWIGSKTSTDLLCVVIVVPTVLLKLKGIWFWVSWEPVQLVYRKIP